MTFASVTHYIYIYMMIHALNDTSSLPSLGKLHRKRNYLVSPIAVQVTTEILQFKV